MDLIGSYIWVLSHQGVELLERIRRIRKCGLVEGGVSLGMGFKVTKIHAKRSVSLFPDA